MDADGTQPHRKPSHNNDLAKGSVRYSARVDFALPRSTYMQTDLRRNDWRRR